MEQEIAEYEIGKRFLANMMGEDPNDFEQDKIDVRDSLWLNGPLFLVTFIAYLEVLLFLIHIYF